MFSTAMQAQGFLAAVYAGLLSGVAYDLLRLLRLSLRAGWFITALLDILFWMLTAGLLGAAAAFSGVPGLRFFLILGLCCGMLIWAVGLRRVIFQIVHWVLGIVRKKEAGNALPDGEMTNKGNSPEK